MSFRKASVAAIVALSMTSAPVLAQAVNPAEQLAVAGSEMRTGAELTDENNLYRRGGFLIPLLALGAVILGLLVLLDDDEDDLPESP